MVPCAATMYVCGIESEALRKQNRYKFGKALFFLILGLQIFFLKILRSEEGKK